jgi:hypothetical protein
VTDVSDYKQKRSITDKQHFKSFKVKDVALRGNFGFIEFETALVSC